MRSAPAPQRAAAASSAPGSGFALWRLGFRPFYLLASLFAALSVALWAAQFTGLLAAAVLPSPAWHAHEMLFGFTLAVVVGFLLTAVRNWTEQPTASGAWLAGLAGLWLAARVLVLTPYAGAAAVANVAFPLAAALAIAIPLVAAGNRRNYFFVLLLVGMAAAALAFHLAQAGVWALPPQFGLQLALDIVLFVLAVMAGRVVPMFTNNGVPGAGAQRHPLVERCALGSLLALLGAQVLAAPPSVLAALAVFAAGAHLARWLLWHPWRTRAVPLVWVLHLAYAWIPVHLLLRAAGLLGMVAPSAAVHALAVGALGGLTIGMMSRTARGHTGRPLRADGADVACYLLVFAAALARVGVPLVAPQLTLAAAGVAAVLWSGAFALYVLRYAPSLTRPRADGRPG
ncbi:NnrS family protein [Ramlibacter sp. AN1015]|uniref:NnrS family protein n=1 Tax=Ramlibacter sp. AN1015 TaxID=3133428 RepID=UPI0030BFCF3A